MKTMFLFLAGSLLTLTGFAQTYANNPYPRTITANGSAEMEIVPDEIYVQVVLKEYDKKGNGKITIDKIRQDFLTAVRSLGLPEDAVSVSNYDAYSNPWLRKKNKKEELYATITYQVKLRNTTQVDQLVDKLDDNATQNFYISRVTHSKMEEFRKNLKIEAIKSAKEKAQYLADAVNEKIGVAITINEPNEYYPQPMYNAMASNRMMKAEAQSDAAPEQPQADFKKIKIRYEVTVVFELK
ncbi:SIMPL domain-containing protein [Flavisolibacter ginsenosidimutans]|nr:SIMPL domain-containing protein [Flavisolibacter ginsenosidimutans]